MFCFVLCSVSFHKFSFKHLRTEANFLSLPGSIVTLSLKSSVYGTVQEKQDSAPCFQSLEQKLLRPGAASTLTLAPESIHVSSMSTLPLVLLGSPLFSSPPRAGVYSLNPRAAMM